MKDILFSGQLSYPKLYDIIVNYYKENKGIELTVNPSIPSTSRLDCFKNKIIMDNGYNMEPHFFVTNMKNQENSYDISRKEIELILVEVFRTLDCDLYSILFEDEIYLNYKITYYDNQDLSSEKSNVEDKNELDDEIEKEFLNIFLCKTREDFFKKTNVKDYDEFSLFVNNFKLNVNVYNLELKALFQTCFNLFSSLKKLSKKSKNSKFTKLIKLCCKKYFIFLSEIKTELERRNIPFNIGPASNISFKDYRYLSNYDYDEIEYFFEKYGQTLIKISNMIENEIYGYLDRTNYKDYIHNYWDFDSSGKSQINYAIKVVNSYLEFYHVKELDALFKYYLNIDEMDKFDNYNLLCILYIATAYTFYKNELKKYAINKADKYVDSDTISEYGSASKVRTHYYESIYEDFYRNYESIIQKTISQLNNMVMARDNIIK